LLAVLSQQRERTAVIRLSERAVLVAPQSMHWEIGNALSAMFKRRAIDLSQALALLEAYRAVPIRLAEIALTQAVEIAASLKIYAYDAYVIACALNHRAPLLTLDQTLAAHARSLSIDVPEVAVP
jgi:predicted nucleic acid-binding protein